jgi:hypothetical protein
MRKIAELALVVGLLGVVPPTASAAAAVALRQSGAANATFTYSVHTGAKTITGTYNTTGQLGIGTFRLSDPGDPGAAGCENHTPALRARFVRNDGAVLRGTATGDTDACGVHDLPLSIDLTTGARDLVRAHVTLDPTTISTNATPSGGTGVVIASLTATVEVTRRVGYSLLDQIGGVTSYGGTYPGLTPRVVAGAIDVDVTPKGDGFRVLDGAGEVFDEGVPYPPHLGNLDRSRLAAGERAVALMTTPTNRGYWIVTDRGRVQAFGDAVMRGDVHAIALHAPIVGATASPTGKGYWLAASDGGVFAFGDARFRGSMGGHRLNEPVVGIAPTRDGSGYWLAASDGGVFSFNAKFRGSLGGVHLVSPVVDIARYGAGYVMAGADGGIFAFANAPFFGSLAGAASQPVVALSAAG